MNKKEYLVAVREELAGLKSTELQKEMQKLEIKVKLITFTKIEKVMTYLKEKSILLKLTVVR